MTDAGPHTQMPIVLLAAGTSSRMRGRDKLMEDVGGQPLITRQAALARRVTSGPVIVTLPAAPHPRHSALAGLDVIRLAVGEAHLGMSISLQAGIAAVPQTARHAMILLADLPELTDYDLKILLQAVVSKPDHLVWRGATAAGKPGHPIVVAYDLFGAFMGLSGDSGGREVIAAAGNRVVHVPLTGNHALLDLDTPEDWSAWRRRQAAPPDEP